jgi:hypothetical protein
MRNSVHHTHLVKRRRRRLSRRIRQALASLAICASVFFAAFATAGAIDAMKFHAARMDAELRSGIAALCVDANLDHDRARLIEERALALLDERTRAREAGLDGILPTLDAHARQDLKRIVKKNVADDVIVLVTLYSP